MSLAPDELPAASLAALAVAALFVGFAKTAVGGMAGISVAVFATVLPARESTGALLPLLLVGDVVAVGAYRRHARWPLLLRLLPWVVVGVVLGTVFVAYVDDVAMRRTIGVVLLVLVAVRLWERRPRPSAPARMRGGSVAGGYGLLAGFTTMVANSGGAVMAMYLLSSRLAVLGFLGTSAWFFLLVNLGKVPFSMGLGLITVDSLALGTVLAPAVLVGAALGRAVIKRIDERLFERVVLVVTVLSSLYLVR